MTQAEGSTGFILEKQVEIWVRKLRSEPSLTEKDIEELKTHLLDEIDQLKEKGLDDEEAFLVASKRMGTLSDLDSDFREANNPILQIRRSAIILAGVLVYFLIYYFIEFSSKIILIISLNGGVNGNVAVNLVSRYLLGSHFLIISFIIGIYFLETKVISFIENVKLKPKHTILLLITTLTFSILNISASPIIRNMMNQDHHFIDRYLHVYRNFGYTFPLIVCTGFIFIYFKYYKIAKF